MWDGFEWDPAKAIINAEKHRVTFLEARAAFDDPFSMTILDPDHSLGEERFILIGATTFGKIVVVAHVLRGENIRIINARLANSNERRTYEEA